MIFTTLRHVSCFPKITWMFHNGSGKMLFGQLRQKFNFLAKMHKALFRGKTALKVLWASTENVNVWWRVQWFTYFLHRAMWMYKSTIVNVRLCLFIIVRSDHILWVINAEIQKHSLAIVVHCMYYSFLSLNNLLSESNFHYSHLLQCIHRRQTQVLFSVCKDLVVNLEGQIFQ